MNDIQTSADLLSSPPSGALQLSRSVYVDVNEPKLTTPPIRCFVSSKARRPQSAPIATWVESMCDPPRNLSLLPSSPTPMNMWQNGRSTSSPRKRQRVRQRSTIFTSKPKNPVVPGQDYTETDFITADLKRWNDVRGHVQFGRICSREQREKLFAHGADCHNLEISDPISHMKTEVISKRIPMLKIDGQSSRDSANKAYGRAKDVNDFNYHVTDPNISGGSSGYTAMDKVSSREQRAKGMGYFAPNKHSCDMVFYDINTTTPNKAPNMERSAARTSIFDTSSVGEHRFYDANYALTQEMPKLVMRFDGYIGRSRPSSSMRRHLRVNNRDLDIALNPKYPDNTRNQGNVVNMAKQLPRDAALKSFRINPHRIVDEAVLPLHPKYTALDPSTDKIVAFNRQLSRGTDSRTKLMLRAHSVTAQLEPYSALTSFDSTHGSVKGFSMDKQLSRKCQGGSRLAVCAMSNENVSKKNNSCMSVISKTPSRVEEEDRPNNT